MTLGGALVVGPRAVSSEWGRSVKGFPVRLPCERTEEYWQGRECSLD